MCFVFLWTTSITKPEAEKRTVSPVLELSQICVSPIGLCFMKITHFVSHACRISWLAYHQLPHLWSFIFESWFILRRRTIFQTASSDLLMVTYHKQINNCRLAGACGSARSKQLVNRIFPHHLSSMRERRGKKTFGHVG